LPTRASLIRREAVGKTVTRDGRTIWVPSAYARDLLNLVEIDCGPTDDGAATEQRVTAAFRAALQARKAWRERRREESLTLTPEQLRERRNQEVAERSIDARASQDKEAA
jgi:hypothetical protein